MQIAGDPVTARQEGASPAVAGRGPDGLEEAAAASSTDGVRVEAATEGPEGSGGPDVADHYIWNEADKEWQCIHDFGAIMGVPRDPDDDLLLDDIYDFAMISVESKQLICDHNGTRWERHKRRLLVVQHDGVRVPADVRHRL